MRYKTIHVPITPEEEAAANQEDAERRYAMGSARPEETCEQRNMRMGWGCKCHGETFCSDYEFAYYEDDQPVFRRKE